MFIQGFFERDTLVSFNFLNKPRGKKLTRKRICADGNEMVRMGNLY